LDDTIILNVHIKAAAGKGPELLAKLSALLEPSRSEPGCLQYLLHTDPEDPDKLMFYEAFANQKALDEHLAAPYFQAFLKYREDAMPDPMESATVTRWQPVTV
jgi:quinol monooxygenase YgiN